MGSTRLPDKVLADISGLPMLARIIERVSVTPDINEIVLATTTSPKDDRLIDWMNANFVHVTCFRGDESDVLDRFYKCAKLHRADLIVRITADDPLKDATIIQKAINYFFLDPTLDYCSNTIRPTYPEGLDVEVFKSSALEKAWLKAQLPSEREHVTPYIWKNVSLFKVQNFEYERDLSAWRWTVDRPVDLLFMDVIHKNFVGDLLVNFEKVIQYLDANPELIKINDEIIRNEGYLKAINGEIS
jgi:spore coat polysaccharide biosynthesis protein SpsF